MRGRHMPTSSTLNVATRFGEYAQKRQNTAALQNIAVLAHAFLALRFGVRWCSTAFRWSKSTLNFHLSPHNNNGVSSRGWHSTPRDLTPASSASAIQPGVQRFRRDAHLCDLIAARGPSPSARFGMTHIHSCQEVRRPILLRYQC
jgi:hypothetical protein